MASAAEEITDEVVGLALGVVWVGYTGVFYGWSILQDWGIGLTDLVMPSRVDKVRAAMKPAAFNLGNIPGDVAGTNPPRPGGAGLLYPPGVTPPPGSPGG